MDQLTKLKVMLEIPSSDVSRDDLLQLLLDSAESDILVETNRIVLPTALLDSQLQLAVIKFNRLGIEGEQGHSEGNVSRTIYVLNEDAPASLRRKIERFRLLKVATYETP